MGADLPVGKYEVRSDGLRCVQSSLEQTSLAQDSVELAHASSAFVREDSQNLSRDDDENLTSAKRYETSAARDLGSEEFIAMSICAACIQATANGNARRSVELRGAIRDFAKHSSSTARGYCHGKKPLLGDCPLAKDSNSENTSSCVLGCTQDANL